MKSLLVLCACLAAVLASPTMPKGLTDDMVEFINNANVGWKAGHNFAPGTTVEDIRKLLGVKIGERKGHVIKHIEPLTAVPPEFDARVQWPNCPSIGEIRDQAACGSCWAFGAVEAMTDRYCIASGGAYNAHVSAEDLNDCCFLCGAGCNGGDPAEAWSYWVRTGLVTGGNYNSGEGCLPYSIPSCDHHVDGSANPCENTVSTPACSQQCISGYGTAFSADKQFGSDSYGIQPRNVAAMQTELMTKGPFEVDFNVFEDFLSYKSGIYCTCYCDI
ncbi:hypothetical protein CHUAL_006588 [Chamberlinius hualienensis]